MLEMKFKQKKVTNICSYRFLSQIGIDGKKKADYAAKKASVFTSAACNIRKQSSGVISKVIQNIRHDRNTKQNELHYKITD